MTKPYRKWSVKKQYLEAMNRIIYAHQREIWWCSLGINIGAEIDGKNDNFERPVLVLKVYNKDTLIVLPLTTKVKNDPFHQKVTSRQKTVWAKLTQARVISNKRLIRKVDIVEEGEFQNVILAWIATL